MLSLIDSLIPIDLPQQLVIPLPLIFYQLIDDKYDSISKFLKVLECSFDFQLGTDILLALLAA